MRQKWWLGPGSLGLLLLGCMAPAAGAEPAIWTLKDEDTTITLLGSVHALPGSLSWRTPRLDSLIAQADEIWFERHPLRGSDLDLLLSLAFTADQRPLSSRLSPEAAGRLSIWIRRENLSPAAVDRLQPWAVALLIDAARSEEIGAEPEWGVEEQVAELAGSRKRLQAFDGTADVLRFLPARSEGEALRMLEDALDAWARGTKDQSMIKAWAVGRTALIEELMEKQRSAYPEFHSRLITDRNRRWADQIATLLHKPGRVLVVVGAGHLVGREGVPSLLRARGLQVEGP